MIIGSGGDCGKSRREGSPKRPSWKFKCNFAKCANSLREPRNLNFYAKCILLALHFLSVLFIYFFQNRSRPSMGAPDKLIHQSDAALFGNESESATIRHILCMWVPFL